jgi:hypothetical protein
VSAERKDLKMQCTNCLKIVPEEANVCGYCGHVLKSGVGRPEPVQQGAPPPVPYQDAEKPGKSRGLTLLVGLVVLVGAFGAAYVYLKDQNEAAEAEYAVFEATEDARMNIQEATSEAQQADFQEWVDYVRDTDVILTDWDSVYGEATRSNRIEMPEQIEKLQEIRSQAAGMSYTSKFSTAHETLIAAMDVAIESLEDWQRGGTQYQALQDQYQEYRDEFISQLNSIPH